MMRKFLLLFVTLLSVAAHAEQTYKLEKVDGKYICRGSVACRLDDRQTFGSAVLWAIEQGDDEKSSKGIMEAYDAKALTVAMKPTIAAGDNNYVFNLTMQVQGGQLEFLVEKIKCVPKGVLGGFTSVNFDKVNLEKKPERKELIDRFETLCDTYMQNILAEILSKEGNLGNWEAISKGQVVKGMTEKECIMAVGKPASVTENTQRVQWTYESGMIVVFEDGIVTAIVK